MTDPLAQHAAYLEALDRLTALEKAAWSAPWWYDEDDDVFRLHGTAHVIPAQGSIPEQYVNAQILKAPKRGTPYAEYSPPRADADLIVGLRNDAVRSLESDEVLDVLDGVGKVYDAAMASLAEVEIPGEREDVAREVRGG